MLRTCAVKICQHETSRGSREYFGHSAFDSLLAEMASINHAEESIAPLKAACTELGCQDSKLQTGRKRQGHEILHIYRSLYTFLARENGVGDGSSLLYPPVVVDVIRHLYPGDIKDYVPKSRKRRNFYEVPLRELLEVYREGDLREEFTRPRENPDSEVKKRKL